jgi:toxin-antitoxin system PIN domain toxin
MNLVDSNILLYAVNESERHHDEARSWLDLALGGAVTVGFPWLVLLAFLRLSTKREVFDFPLSVDQALDRVRLWLAQPVSTIVHPGARHFDILSGLLLITGGGGNLISDAHLAALAIEHRGTLVTYDTDFSRFPDLRWQRPSYLSGAR